jgi:hypothetical protein
MIELEFCPSSSTSLIERQVWDLVSRQVLGSNTSMCPDDDLAGGFEMESRNK